METYYDLISNISILSKKVYDMESRIKNLEDTLLELGKVMLSIEKSQLIHGETIYNILKRESELMNNG